MALPMDAELPLVVDLDGTLIRSDLLLETLLAAARNAPWIVVLVPFWLLRGRAGLKRELARRSAVAAEDLPYRPEILSLLATARAQGRRTVLATAADELVASEVARHAGIDEVIASDGLRNLKGSTKRDALVARFGERGFDYVGDSIADIRVWGAARRAWVVGGDAGLLAAARGANQEAEPVELAPRRPRAWLRALRVHQWPKNILVFVPLLTAHRWDDNAAAVHAVVAFAAFCLVASAIYVANDLLDLAADRQHEAKRHRPFASGELPLAAGLALVPLLLAASFALAAIASRPLFAAVILAYAGTALAYSLRLKQVVAIDVLVIAGLYTLRILGGAVAVGVPLSHWLLAFSMFMFLSLALAKRHGELAKHLALPASTDRLPGRGYVPGDAPVVASLGTASGYLSVLVLALYINSETVAVLYTRPLLLWAIPTLVLYWITRTWLLAHRGVIAEDPLSFALRDPASHVVAIGLVSCVYFAT